MVTRALLAALVAALACAGCGTSPSASATPSPAAAPADPEAVAEAIAVSVTVDGAALGAARTMADFGVGQELRMVPIRIVEQLALTVRIEADRDVTLAGPPWLCLTGPFWNPLDAGLSDRCWGDPDLAGLAADRFERDGAGRVVLRAGQPVEIDATLVRGDERCDYAPGDWLLEVEIEPVIGGIAAERLAVTKAPLSAPFDGAEPLVLRPTSETRVCSYGAAVWTRQGDPPLREP